MKRFILSVVFMCTPLEEAKIRCNQHCIDQGDKSSWLDGKVCVCGNPSNPENGIFRVETNIKGKVIKDEQKKSWFDE